MSRTHHQLWRRCGSGSMVHSVGEKQPCERHLRVAVLFEQQQVVHVLGFLLPVNLSLFGSSTNSQKSSMIWFRLQHSQFVASWSGWYTCDPPMATGAKQSPLSCFYSIILATERSVCHKMWMFFLFRMQKGLCSHTGGSRSWFYLTNRSTSQVHPLSIQPSQLLLKCKHLLIQNLGQVL